MSSQYSPIEERVIRRAVRIHRALLTMKVTSGVDAKQWAEKFFLEQKMLALDFTAAHKGGARVILAPLVASWLYEMLEARRMNRAVNFASISADDPRIDDKARSAFWCAEWPSDLSRFQNSGGTSEDEWWFGLAANAALPENPSPSSAAIPAARQPSPASAAPRNAAAHPRNKPKPRPIVMISTSRPASTPRDVEELDEAMEAQRERVHTRRHAAQSQEVLQQAQEHAPSPVEDTPTTTEPPVRRSKRRAEALANQAAPAPDAVPAQTSKVKGRKGKTAPAIPPPAAPAPGPASTTSKVKGKGKGKGKGKAGGSGSVKSAARNVASTTILPEAGDPEPDAEDEEVDEERPSKRQRTASEQPAQRIFTADEVRYIEAAKKIPLTICAMCEVRGVQCTQTLPCQTCGPCHKRRVKCSHRRTGAPPGSKSIWTPEDYLDVLLRHAATALPRFPTDRSQAEDPTLPSPSPHPAASVASPAASGPHLGRLSPAPCPSTPEPESPCVPDMDNAAELRVEQLDLDAMDDAGSPAASRPPSPSPPPAPIQSEFRGITTPSPGLSSATNRQTDTLSAAVDRLRLQLGTHAGVVAEVRAAQEGYADLQQRHLTLQKEFEAFRGVVETRLNTHDESLEKLRDGLSTLGTDIHSDVTDLSLKMTSRIDQLRDMLQDSPKAAPALAIPPSLFSQPVQPSYNSATSIPWGSGLARSTGGSSHSVRGAGGSTG